MNAHREFVGVAAAFAGCVCVLVVAVGAEASGAKQRGAMQLTSTAFSQGEPIPEKYTCEGKNISPPLRWSNAPSAAQSLALIVDDPDAPGGTWVHWVLYDLPQTNDTLLEDLPKSQYTPQGAKQGLNDFKHLGYGGPCPPPGKPHRYMFKLYALDVALNLNPGATKRDLESAMEKHILAEGRLMGTYKRK